MVIHPKKLSILSLCSGIGGLDLGIKLANPLSKCVCYVEGEAYATAILIKRMEEKILDEAPIWDNIRTFDGKPWHRKVDCIIGGLPCQPYSLAGPMLGEQDSRHLWGSAKRIIGEINPNWLFFENVSNQLRMGFEQIHDDLQEMDYRIATGLFTAAEVSAPHKRERLFVLGVSRGWRWNKELHEQINLEQSCKEDKRENEILEEKRWRCLSRITSRTSNEMALYEHRAFPPLPGELNQTTKNVEPTILGSINGSSTELDEIRLCGNSVVPLVAAYAWTVLENSLRINSTIK